MIVRKVSQVGFVEHQQFLFRVAADRGQQFLGSLRPLVIREAGPCDMRVDVLCDDLVEQAIHCTPNSGDQMKDGGAVILVAQRALDGSYLAANASHASDQISVGMGEVGHTPSPYRAGASGAMGTHRPLSAVDSAGRRNARTSSRASCRPTRAGGHPAEVAWHSNFD